MTKRTNRGWPRSRPWILAAGWSCVAAVASAQATGKIVGARLRTPEPFNLVRIPEAQKAVVTATLQKLYDIVRRDTMFYEPIGFDVQPSARADIPPRPGYAPVEYDLPGFLYAYGKDVPATESSRPTLISAFYVHGNGLGRFFLTATKWQEDAQGVMYWEPPRQPDVKGFPSYGKGFVVITKSERPIFVPVARERVMRLVIENGKKTLAMMTGPHQQAQVEPMKACVAKLEQELASLSPADRAGPAYLTMGRVPGRDPICDPFSSASDRQARRIIAENPNFYDKSLPPSAIQVVFVNFGSFNTNVPDRREQLERVKNQLDFTALAALTARP